LLRGGRHQLLLAQMPAVATLLLLVVVVTSSRPGALLGITYGDIDLFVLCDKNTGEIALTIRLRFKKTKPRQKRKPPSVETFFPSIQIH